MRFVTVSYAGREHPGVLEDTEIALLPYADLVAVIQAGMDVGMDAVRNTLVHRELT